MIIEMDQLYDALFISNWTLAEHLLDQGVPVHYKHPKTGMSSLYVAIARHAPLALVKKLVESGRADPNEGDARGFTPLHAACQYAASEEVVNYLLSVGANPNKRAEDGATAMHFAGQFLVSLSVLFALLKAGGRLNLKKKNGGTPLIAAIENGADPDFIRALIEGGADCNACITNSTSGKLETPLSIARRKCSQEVVSMIERGATRSSSQPQTRDDVHRKIEAARLLFRYAVTSSSTLTVSQTQTMDNPEELIIPVKAGEKVTLVYGSLEEGLFPPYENYVLVTANDGRTGKVLKSALYDSAINGRLLV